jgi:hypothetical protein
MLTRWLLLGVFGVLLAGCTSTRITNLTPRTAPRSSDGLYTIEAKWSSNQRSIRKDSFTPFIVVGMDFHPMERVPLTTNRWEGVIPVPANQRFVTYRFKFDYLYDSIPRPRKDSRLSGSYQLQITD